MYPDRIRYLIIDDKELDRMAVRDLADEHPLLEFVGAFSNAFEAISSIRSNSAELLFLDIEMPGINGIDLLRSVRELVPMTVFITSYPEYALDGFELSALDYILKPLTAERFQACMSRVEEYWNMKQKSLAYDVFIETDMITIKQGHDKIRLPLHEVIYLEAMNDYTKLHTEGKNYITLGALSNFLTKLPKDHFYRVHRSYAVAKSKITGVKKKEVFCGSVAIPVGNTYRSVLIGML